MDGGYLEDSRQNPWPEVTVIVVNWNGERFLDRCLGALMAQTVTPREIILLDNASTDNSLEVVRRFPGVRLMVQSRNTGFARGNNLAIATASSDSHWLTLVNPDVYVEPDWLEKLLTMARQNPEFDAFAAKLVNADNPELLDGAGDLYHLSGLVWRRGYNFPIKSIPEVTEEIFSPCAAAAMYRREAFIKVGGFDEDFFCYLEDIDLGFRLRLAGYRSLYVPDSVAYHVGSGTTGGSHSDFAVYHGHRNLVWTYIKNMPGPLFWILLPLHLIMNLYIVAVFSFRGQGRIIIRAKLDALKGIPKMWRKRRLVQEKRVARAGDILNLFDKRFW
jgi:GT2 family glycosyltransferase